MIKLNKLKCIDKNIEIEEYIRYRDLVKKNMKYPQWIGDFQKEDLHYLLNNGSKIWMYYTNDEFVCSMMIIPSTKKDITKFGLNIDYKETVDYGPMFVNPNYIGNHLQLQMLTYLDEYSSKAGYKYAVSTVHPDNLYSKNNLEKDGFLLTGTKKFTRGIRSIYVKEL